MPLLTHGSFAQLRGLPFLALSESGYVLTLQGSDNAGGGVSGTWARGSATPLRVDPLSAQAGELGGAINERSTAVITLPPSYPVNPRNRVEVVGRGTYEVTAMRPLTSEFVREIEVAEQ